MKTSPFPVEVEIDEDGVYMVSYTAFKASHAVGHAIDEALRNLSEVVEMCLEK